MCETASDPEWAVTTTCRTHLLAKAARWNQHLFYPLHCLLTGTTILVARCQSRGIVGRVKHWSDVLR